MKEWTGSYAVAIVDFPPSLSSLFRNRWYFSAQPATGSWLMGDSSWISSLHIAPPHLLRTANKRLFERLRVPSMPVSVMEESLGPQGTPPSSSSWLQIPICSCTWVEEWVRDAFCPFFTLLGLPLPPLSLLALWLYSLLTQPFHYLSPIVWSDLSPTKTSFPLKHTVTGVCMPLRAFLLFGIKKWQNRLMKD